MKFFNINKRINYSRKEAKHKLQHKQAHRHQAQPRVQRIKVRNWWLGQVMRIEHGQESHHDTRNAARMEQRVGQLDVDVLHATAQPVQQDGYRERMYVIGAKFLVVGWVI